MRNQAPYPASKIISQNVITAAGALPVSCKVENGKIVTALSAVKGDGMYPANVVMTAYSAGAKRFFVYAGGIVYFSSGGTGFLASGAIESKFPFLFEKRENGGVKAYFAGKDYCVTHDGQYLSSYNFDMPVYGAVFRYGRFFGIDNDDAFKIRWSGSGGAFDWVEGISGAGWVNLEIAYGKVLDLVNFKDKLCAVRENGITVISAFGTPENFTVKHADNKTPKIFKSTAAVAGDKLVFCTERGLYAFDGNSITKISCGLCEDIQNPKYAVSLGDEYFLCGESKSLNKGAILVYDEKNNDAYLIDEQADALLSNGKIYTYFNNHACVLQPGKGFSFTSGNLFFSGKRKVLKSIEIDCDGEVEVEVSNGVKSSIFGGQFKKIIPKMSGKYFKITVRGTGEVREISAYAEVINGV